MHHAFNVLDSPGLSYSTVYLHIRSLHGLIVTSSSYVETILLSFPVQSRS